MRSYSSSIPFSWESRPGIPKTIVNNNHHRKNPPIIDGTAEILLPLPPPLKPTSNRNHSSFLKNLPPDPFTIALMKFSKAGRDLELEVGASKMESSQLLITGMRRRRRQSALMDLFNDYLCKKNSVSVADSNVCMIHNRRSSRGYDYLYRWQWWMDHVCCVLNYYVYVRNTLPVGGVTVYQCISVWMYLFFFTVSQ